MSDLPSIVLLRLSSEEKQQAISSIENYLSGFVRSDMTILECKNILTAVAVMEPWIERSHYKLLSGQPRAGRDEIILSPYVLFLLVLTMKTNEALGYQGCPIHLLLRYFPLPGPDLGSHWVVSPH